MQIPIVCYTCGRPISHKWREYQSMINVKNSTLSRHEYSNQDISKLKFDALAKLKIGDICCRKTYLCENEWYKIIYQ